MYLTDKYILLNVVHVTWLGVIHSTIKISIRTEIIRFPRASCNKKKIASSELIGRINSTRLRYWQDSRVKVADYFPKKVKQKSEVILPRFTPSSRTPRKLSDILLSRNPLIILQTLRDWEEMVRETHLSGWIVSSL